MDRVYGGDPSGCSDEDLIARVGDGDRTAFRIIIDRFAGRGFAVALRLLGRRHDAEDALQEAFLKLWTAAPRFDADRGVRLSTWFYRILTNVCIDASRRSRPTATLDDAAEVADDAVGAFDALADKRRSRKVGDALSALPDRQRMAIMLCFFEGQSNAKAAEALGVSVHALEGLLTRGRRRLRELLADQMPEQEGNR